MRYAAGVVVLAAACGRVGFDPPPDAEVARCTTRMFGTPVLVDGVNDVDANITLRLQSNELDGVFWSLRAGNGDLYSAQRPDRASPFTVAPIAALNVPASLDVDPTVPPDGSFVVFGSGRPGGAGSFDLYEAARAGATFGVPTLIAMLATAASESQPNWSPAESALYFASDRDGASRIYRAVRDGIATYEAPERMDSLAGADGEEFDPTPSADGLVMYFRSSRTGGPGGTDAYVATRASLTEPFGPAMLVQISSPSIDGPSFISPDLCRLYFTSNRDGVTKIYVAER